MDSWIVLDDQDAHREAIYSANVSRPALFQAVLCGCDDRTNRTLISRLEVVGRRGEMGAMVSIRGLARELAVILFSSLSACIAAGCGGHSLPSPTNPIAQPQEYQLWKRAINAARHPLNVTFVAESRRALRRVYQPDWAGPVLFAPGEKPLVIPAHRFHIVEGEWVVPKARPTINCSNPHEPVDGSSLWIAIDGWSATFKAHVKGKDGKWHTYNSTDILQAGSESDVPCYHGGTVERYPTSSYFWIEWSGVRNVAVTRHHRNLKLHPGDRIYVRIDAATSGPRAWREATLWFVNETTGQYFPARTFHSGCIDCGTPFSRPATLFGDTAEWMVEATFYSSIRRSLPNTLDDFGNVTMTHVFATDQDGRTYDLEHPRDARLNLDWMTWNGVHLSKNGTLLACSSIGGARTATFARAPYVIATPGQQGDLEPKPRHCQ